MSLFKSDTYYYSHPYQVIFLREKDGKPTYRKGIVFHEWVIDAIDGSYFKTRAIVKLAHKYDIDEDYAIVESFDWVPLKIE